MHKDKDENGILPHIHSHEVSYRSRELGSFEHSLLEGDMFLQVSWNKIFFKCKLWLFYLLTKTVYATNNSQNFYYNYIFISLIQ